MSANDVSRHVFHHAQLTRPPDNYCLPSANQEHLHEQHDASPMDSWYSHLTEASQTSTSTSNMDFTNQMPEEHASGWYSDYYTDAQGPDYFADEQDPEEDYTSD